MAQLFTNNAVTTLAADCTAAAVSLTVAAGSGAKFPAPANGDYFLATLYTTDASGNVTAAEIVQVTARAGDVLTIVRAQEGTAAQAWSAATAKLALMLTAGAMPALQNVPQGRAFDGTFGRWWTKPGVIFGHAQGASSKVLAASTLYYEPFLVETPITLDRMGVDVMTADAAAAVVRLGIASANRDWQPRSLLLDAGTINPTTSGTKIITISQTLAPGRYLALVNTGTGGPTYRGWDAANFLNGLDVDFRGNFANLNNAWSVARAQAAFADPLPSASGQESTSARHFFHAVFFRVSTP